MLIYVSRRYVPLVAEVVANVRDDVADLRKCVLYRRLVLSRNGVQEVVSGNASMMEAGPRNPDSRYQSRQTTSGVIRLRYVFTGEGTHQQEDKYS